MSSGKWQPFCIGLNVLTQCKVCIVFLCYMIMSKENAIFKQVILSEKTLFLSQPMQLEDPIV